MPESSTSDDLLAAVSSAFRGDGTTARELLAGVQQRARERLRATVRGELDPLPAFTSSPEPNSPPPRPQRTPRPGPDRPVEIRLQGGGRFRAVLSPAVAKRSDLDAIGRASAANDRQAFAAIR